MAELPRDLIYFVPVLYDLDAPEHDHAADVQRPLAFPAVSAVINAERHFVMAPDRIIPVSLHPGVKIQFAVFLAIKMIDWHSIRIIVVSEHRQYAARFFFQYLNTFRLGNLLFKTKHFSKHGHFSFSLMAFEAALN